MVLLREEIFAELKPDQVMTAAQAILIERFSKFICLPYIKWRVWCFPICESRLVDLEFLKDIRAWPDRHVAEAAENGLKLQAFYLTKGAQSSDNVFLLAVRQPEGSNVHLDNTVHARGSIHLQLPEQEWDRVW